MPPKAKATGVAALAEARAAFAGKARPQSAGLSTRGTEPQGTLPPSGPAPVATRRWIRGGWDADYYYDNKNAKEPGRTLTHRPAKSVSCAASHASSSRQFGPVCECSHALRPMAS